MYQRGKIYTIRSHQTDKVYVGSTVQPLCKRISCHRKDYKSYLNGTYHFVSSFTILEYEDAYIELHENYPCNSKEELFRKEGEVIREFGERCVNKHIAGRTQKEYCKENKEKLKEKAKKYYETNKDRISEKHKEYSEVNKSKIKENKKKYREANKDKIKEYFENNKDKLNEKKKKFREDNKVRLKEERIEKVECTCGVVITKGCLSRHKKTQKHQDFEKNKLK